MHIQINEMLEGKNLNSGRKPASQKRSVLLRHGHLSACLPCTSACRSVGQSAYFSPVCLLVYACHHLSTCLPCLCALRTTCYYVCLPICLPPCCHACLICMPVRQSTCVSIAYLPFHLLPCQPVCHSGMKQMRFKSRNLPSGATTGMLKHLSSS